MSSFSVDLTGRVALVTGAGQGLGASVMRRLAASGATAVGADLDADAVAASAAAAGPGADHVMLDVRESASWSAAVDALVERHGRFDILVNNAGVYRNKPLIEWADDEIDLVLDVNLRGTLLGVREAARRMDDGGAIVNVASTASLGGLAGAAPYSASKFGVRGITRSAARELGARGIRVNSVSPGPIQTAMMNSDRVDWSNLPLGRAADPDEIATLIAFLCSDAAGFSTGGDHAVDGGLTA